LQLIETLQIFIRSTDNTPPVSHQTNRHFFSDFDSKLVSVSSTTMSSSNANKENEGPTAAVAAPNKNLVIYSTDMTPEMRSNVIQIATKAFASPVTSGKVYQSIADKIKTECEKEVCGDGGGWSCVVGGAYNIGLVFVLTILMCLHYFFCITTDAFGSSVTHRMKTYIHFSIVPNVTVLLWRA